MSDTNILQTIELPSIKDDCLLIVAESPTIPFEVKRVYVITEPKEDLPRGYHAHRETRQVLFCISGSVRLVLDDGRDKEEMILKNPATGVLLDKMIWHEMHDMNPDTILLVLASERYNEADYIRDYEEFLLEVSS